MSSHHGYESYDQIMVPIANELSLQREKYPMTIIYLKLKYCSHAYGLFESLAGQTVCRWNKRFSKALCTSDKVNKEEQFPRSNKICVSASEHARGQGVSSVD